MSNHCFVKKPKHTDIKHAADQSHFLLRGAVHFSVGEDEPASKGMKLLGQK